MSNYISEKRDKDIYIYRVTSTIRDFGNECGIQDASISARVPDASTTLIRFDVNFTDDQSIYSASGVYTRPANHGEWCRLLDLNDIDWSDLDPEADNPYPESFDGDQVISVREYYEYLMQVAVVKILFGEDLSGFVDRDPEPET